MIFVGDVGGTKTRLALFDRDDIRVPQASQVYASRDYHSFADVVRDFRAGRPEHIELACVGVAGPIRDNRVQATNLPWTVDGADLAAELGLAYAGLLNDLEAFAYGVGVLGAADLVQLQAGDPEARGNRGVIAAGTGLGEAGLYWDGERHHPFGTEGGHGDFAPQDEIEIELLRFLAADLDHVSAERVVSGLGIVNIYRFMKETGREDEPAWLAAEMRDGDPAEVISAHARDGSSALCARTMDLFVRAYGAEAGDFALKVMATGGVFVAGGPARKNLDRMTAGSFIASFNAKGRMRPLMEAIPVHIILNDQASLIGAAQCARIRERAGRVE